MFKLVAASSRRRAAATAIAAAETIEITTGTTARQRAASDAGIAVADLSFPPHLHTSRRAMRNQYDEADVRRMHRAARRRTSPPQFTPDKPLNIVGIRTRGETLAERLTGDARRRAASRRSAAACSTSRSTATTSPRSARGRWSGRRRSTSTSTACRCCWWTTCSSPADRIRAALDALSDFGRPERDPPGGPGRPRRARAADPAGLRRADAARDVPKDHA